MYWFLSAPPWCGVGCKKDNLWDVKGGETGGTGTIWSCTENEICVRVGVGVENGITIVGILVARPRSSDILTSEFLVLSPYSSYGTTDGVLCRMARMSVTD